MADINEIGFQPEEVLEQQAVKKGIGLFFGDKEANFFLNAGREITENILQESFLLYRIDIKNTPTHKLYGESKKKLFKEEIEIFGRINVDSKDPERISKGGPIKKGMGEFTAHIYIEQLRELGMIEMENGNTLVYDMREGDFIAFKGQYYKIYDNGFSNITNKNSWAGDRRFYITVKAIEIDEDVFRAR